MIISTEARAEVVQNIIREKMFNIALVSFLFGSAVSGIIILLLTSNMIKDARLEAYEKCKKAETQIKIAENLIQKNRKDFLLKAKLIKG